ncbi:hypothetical protein [Candidatus Uabimicrobium sp. HlEnr_7]|uniref:hypothetical protein n=1 Tax=Candidatus Uabimicrobium helgolandensis TaxID=3095367 RepID=UPI0035575598
MQDQDPKELLVQYGHILAFVVCIAFNGFWYMGAGDARADALITKVERSQKKIAKMKRASKTPPDENMDYSKTVEANWNNTTALSPSPGFKSIYPSANITFEREVPPEDQWISKPTGLQVSVGKEKLSLQWRAPFPLRDKTGKQRQMTKVAGYELVKLWRNPKGKSKRKRYTFGSGTTSFVDEKVETKTLYSYKVRAYSFNTAAKGGGEGEVKGKKAVLSDFSGTKKGKIKSLYEIELLGVAGESAFIKLRRYYKGQNRETTCTIKKGADIEAKNVKVSGLDKRMDFVPGWKLLHLTTRAERTRKITKKVFVRINPDTGKGEYKDVTTEQKYETAAIIFKDEKNKQVKRFKTKK